MLYIRFLNLQNPLQDVEQLYKDGTIKQGDIVCQQYTDKYSHLFMNGTWVKTLYNSKIKQNNEIEDDIEFLSTAIGNNSTNIGEVSTRLNDTSTKLNNVSTRLDNTSNNLNDTSIRLNDVSTRLKDDYVNKTQYLKDEELIASTFADLNNKINNISNIDDVISNYYTTEVIDNKIKDINTSINNTSTRIKELESLYTNTQIDTFISNLNTSINNVSNNVKTVSDKLIEVSTRLDNSSTKLNNVSTNVDDVSSRLNDTSTRLNDTSVRLLNYLTINQYLKDEKLIARAFIDLDDRINAQTELIDNNSKNIADISTNIADISTKLSNYLTKTQYLKDEKLIASTFADVNNKINSLYAEIAELKEQLKSSTK